MQAPSTPADNPNWTLAFRHESARLILSPSAADDAHELAEVMRDPRVYVPYYAAYPGAVHESDDVWLQEQSDWQEANCFTLAARARSTGQIIGAVRFTSDSISYFIFPAHWGCGYGHEMVQASCSYMPGLLGIKVLQTRVLRENFFSRRILEKSGFVFCGLDKQAYRGAATVAVLCYTRVWQ